MVTWQRTMDGEAYLCTCMVAFGDDAELIQHLHTRHDMRRALAQQCADKARQAEVLCADLPTREDGWPSS